MCFFISLLLNSSWSVVGDLALPLLNKSFVVYEIIPHIMNLMQIFSFFTTAPIHVFELWHTKQWPSQQILSTSYGLQQTCVWCPVTLHVVRFSFYHSPLGCSWSDVFFFFPLDAHCTALLTMIWESFRTAWPTKTCGLSFYCYIFFNGT